LIQSSASHDGSAISGLASARSFLEEGHTVLANFGVDGSIVSKYRELGCETFITPRSKWLRKKRLPGYIKQLLLDSINRPSLCRWLKDVAADVVYINTLVDYQFALASKERGIPCIWHIRELFSDVCGEMVLPPIGGKWYVRRELARLATIIVVNSDAVSGNICGHRLIGKTVKIPNCVDPIFFNPANIPREQLRSELGIPQSSFLIGVPGTLRPVKGHSFFLEVLQNLQRKIKNLSAIFLGAIDSEFARNLIKAVQERDMSSHVTFAGVVKDMASFYNAVDVVAIPSLSESFGRTAIEAFAAGTPVIASNVGGLKEIVKDGSNGVLAAYGDVDEWSNGLFLLAKDRQLRTTFTIAAKNDAETFFSFAAYKKRSNDVLTLAQEKHGTR
jgi:glycosyltransferase involved in cell wall biosynthesis